MWSLGRQGRSGLSMRSGTLPTQPTGGFWRVGSTILVNLDHPPPPRQAILPPGVHQSSHYTLCPHPYDTPITPASPPPHLTHIPTTPFSHLWLVHTCLALCCRKLQVARRNNQKLTIALGQSLQTRIDPDAVHYRVSWVPLRIEVDIFSLFSWVVKKD
ncbi:hypothetical protein WG66_015277 [Moniliophthora roreri]|nr:hypothetical protein WG66_015277 [Moniliophthora roreri]